MRVIEIGDKEIAALEQLRRHAEGHPVSLAQLEHAAAHPVGDDPQHAVELPGGLRVVFSVEQQPSGLYRHASFSVLPHRAGVLPQPALVNVVLPSLGFVARAESCTGWVENNIAVNLLEPMTPSG